VAGTGSDKKNPRRRLPGAGDFFYLIPTDSQPVSEYIEAFGDALNIYRFNFLV
jgi:hypothetical protein